MNINNGNTSDAIGGLHQARKEQAASRRAAAKQTPAKRTPAKKAPAKKAVAAAKASGDKPVKLSWQFEKGYAERAKTGQTAAFDGGELAMRPTKDGKWRATYTKDGETTVLADGVAAGKAYGVLVAFSKGQTKEAAK
jgi:hypothetical protein